MTIIFKFVFTNVFAGKTLYAACMFKRSAISASQAKFLLTI